MFKYLVSLVTKTNEAEIKPRVTAGNICSHSLGHLLKKRHLAHSLTSCFCKTIVRPTVNYGVESWTLTKNGKS
jgi:hypothetical protein